MKGLDWRSWRWLALLVLGAGALLVAQKELRHPMPRQRPMIAVGMHHLVVVKSDGSLWAMGLNAFGAVGDGTTNDCPHLVRISSENDWIDIAAGWDFSLALKADGSLWGCGDNGWGQLGNGTTEDSSHPVRLGQSQIWAKIVAGGNHCLALKSDGTLWAWGLCNARQDKDNTIMWSAAPLPMQVGQNCDWGAAAGGKHEFGEHTLGLKTDGTLWGWGRNHAGQLGDGTTAHRFAPVQIGSGKDWKAISAGGAHSCGLRIDGSLWSWGDNSHGRLGDGTTVSSQTPKQVGHSHDWKMVSAGYSHTLALKSAGSLWAWGSNSLGQLGNGTTNLVATPVQIGSATNWVWVGAGDCYSVALKADGSLWMWGQKIGGESKWMTWLRRSVAKCRIPIKLSPSRTMELVPVKIADLGPLPPPTDPH